MMVEGQRQIQIERNLKDTKNGGGENDEGLLLIQTEINLRSIMRIMINENETTSSQLERKSTESGTGQIMKGETPREGENARERCLMAKNSKLI